MANLRKPRTAPTAALAPTSPGRDVAGTVVAVLSAKGGCGKTTFAINLALALHAGGNRRVCLVDLDLDAGDVANSLHLPTRQALHAAQFAAAPGTTAAHPSADRTNRLAIASLVTGYRAGFDCILAPTKPGEAGRVSPGMVENLLTVLPAMYDYIVIDTPTGVPTHVLAAIDHAHHHVLITLPDVPALKSLRLLLDVLDVVSQRHVLRSIVVNCTDPHIALTAAQVEELVRSPIAGRVPFSWDVPASINDGVPILTGQLDHPVGTAIRDFAQTRIGAGAEPVGTEGDWARDPP